MKNNLVLSELASFDPNTVINESTLARCLAVSQRTVRRMEKRGEIPVHFKLGGNSCWIVGNVIDFFHQRAQKAEQQAAKESQRLSQYQP